MPPFIAALKRCSTQNQDQPKSAQQSCEHTKSISIGKFKEAPRVRAPEFQIDPRPKN
jgi:hypothetical protein